MAGRRAERGARGNYARLICHGCRSRKIKCILPDTDNLGPLGAPQARGKACERCRSYNLECILDRTILGRPASKRARPAESVAQYEAKAARLISQHSSRTTSPSPPISDFNGYIFSDSVAGSNSILQGPQASNHPQLPSKQDVFRAMMEPAFFISSILANDQDFGTDVVQATNNFDISLAELISNDLAEFLDSRLLWHRLFLPQLPNLVDIRSRLESDTVALKSSATNLLFASLCLIAIEIPPESLHKHQQIERDLKFAVSYYGQEFLVSPPTHRDSVTVSLLLFNYRPAALVTLQHTSHKALNSSLYIDLASRIAERLDMLPLQICKDLGHDSSATALDRCSLMDLLQESQIYCHDVFLGGYISKPLRVMRNKLSGMKHRTELLQAALQYDHVMSPTMIYHLQYFKGSILLMEGFLNLKQHWNELEGLSTILEEAKTGCEILVNSTSTLLMNLPKNANVEEAISVRSLIGLYKQKIFVAISSVGMLYAVALMTRSGKDGDAGSPNLDSQDTSQLGSHVISSLKNERHNGVSAFLFRFGTAYPSQQQAILEEFVDLTDSLKLNRACFRPPPRHIVMDLISSYKSIVENNLIHLKSFGKLNPSFHKQKELFGQVAHRLRSLIASPCGTIKSAFASGCVYAATIKVLYGLRDLMERLEEKLPDALATQKGSSVSERLPSSALVDEIGQSGSSDALNLWYDIPGLDVSTPFPDEFDWVSAFDLFPELEYQDTLL